MHDYILKYTGVLGNEACIVTQVAHLDSKSMTVAIEVSVNPVTCIKDVLAGLRDALDVVGHLHVQLEAVTYTVPTFSQEDVVSSLEQNGIVLCVKFESTEVEATASRADAILVELVSSSYGIAWSVAIGKCLS